MRTITTQDVNRFSSRFTITSTCWLWTAGVCGYMKYGSFNVGREHWQAHRFSWLIHNGEIPVGMDVLHKCDVPRCVNPNHLFLGNDSINIKDAVAKGRVKVPTDFASRNHKGEKNGAHKLTEHAVRCIKEELSWGISGYAIAKAYRVDASTIADIRHERTWKHVTICATPRPEPR